jgi:hypothetical protein
LKAVLNSSDQKLKIEAPMNRIKCADCGLVGWKNDSPCRRCGGSVFVDGDSPVVSQSKLGRNPEEDRIKREARKKIKYGLGSTAVFAASLAFYTFYGNSHGWVIRFRPQGLAVGLLPVAWTLAGLLQLISGVEFDELSRRWDALPGWERGVIGISVFVGGLIIVLGGIVFVVQIMYWVRTGQW